MLIMDQVTVRIRKKKVADDLSLHAQSGSFYALLGRPDSGKSTVLRLCAGLLKPESGRILINGLDMSQRENQRARYRLIGYMGPQDGYFPRLQIMEYLEVYAHAAGLSGLSARERCMEMLQMAGLERKAEQMVEEQPLGVRRELSLLRAILHRPRLLLLDEPFAGTEISQRLAMEELLSSLSMDGTTIVMASQSLSEVSELCREIGILDKGRVVNQGELSQVLKQARSEAPLYMRLSSGTERAMEVLHRDQQVKTISRDGTHIMVRFTGNSRDEAALLTKLIEAGAGVYSFYRGQSSLEDLLYTGMTGKEMEE